MTSGTASESERTWLAPEWSTAKKHEAPSARLQARGPVNADPLLLLPGSSFQKLQKCATDFCGFLAQTTVTNKRVPLGVLASTGWLTFSVPKRQGLFYS
jgi:hypothetical protein